MSTGVPGVQFVARGSFGVEETLVEIVELAVPKEIVVDAVGVETTERPGAGEGVKTEPR